MKRVSLESLRVVTPCSVAWSSMKGDDAVRFCGQCRKNVYNVAQLSRAEAVALIERAEGRVCMQLTRRADGTIATGDCWAQLRRARKRGLLALAAALPIILAAQLWSQGFGLRALSSYFHRTPPPCPTATPVRGEAMVLGRIRPPADPSPERVVKGEIARPRHHKRSVRAETHLLGGAIALPDDER
jgi:hypothetical protein